MLLEILKQLEMSLYKPEVRRSAERLGTLLHPSFKELGLSGATYTREESISQLSSQRQLPIIWAQNFEVEVISEGLSLLIYRSAHVNESGELYRHANRVSLWQLTEAGWKMRFHQGTPTQPFEKHAT